MADAHLTALRSSVARLHDLAAGLDEEELTGRAYPSEWSVADVLSHLGSGAVITRRRLDDTLTGSETPDDFAPVVWDDNQAITVNFCPTNGFRSRRSAAISAVISTFG